MLKKLGVYKTEDVNVHLLGQLGAEELAGKMSGADIYVQVSHIENSSNSICEAMLLGMPVIASFAGGTSSLIRDKETGILVQDGDPYALAGALMEMTRNPEGLMAMSENARRMAHQRHNKEAVASHLLDTYDQIINLHRRNRAE